MSAGDLARAEQDGVIVELRNLPERVVFCISADKQHKIAAGYGVELTVQDADLALWDEHLPKWVTGPDWYFELPLKIELWNHGDTQKRHVYLDLGACSEGSFCSRVTFDVEVPPVSEPQDGDRGCGS